MPGTQQRKLLPESIGGTNGRNGSLPVELWHAEHKRLLDFFKD
jgi:hypothetical protein